MKIVAHDLRNPIGAIVMGVSLLERKNGDNVSMIDLIRRSANSSLEMVNSLLQVDRAGEPIQKKPEDLLAILHYCTEVLNHKAAEKHQVLILEGIPVTVPVNREKIWHVFSNLISNGIKFSPEHTTLSINLHTENREAVISIKDQGIGIPLEIQDQLFDISGHKGRAGTSGEESFGLGLAICRQIVDAHGGRIWLKSEVDKGTTFFVALPLDN